MQVAGIRKRTWGVLWRACGDSFREEVRQERKEARRREQLRDCNPIPRIQRQKRAVLQRIVASQSQCDDWRRHDLILRSTYDKH